MPSRLRSFVHFSIVMPILWLIGGTGALAACLVPSLFLVSHAGGIAWVIPIEMVRLGETKLPMMIDTGSPLSIIAPDVAARLASSTTADAPVRLMGAAGPVTALTLRIHGVVYGDEDVGTARFVILSVMQLTLPNGTPVAGVIGRNLLQRVDLDLIGSAVAGRCTAARSRVSIEPAEPSPAMLDGHEFAATLDTGSGISNMSRHLFRLSGLDRAGAVPMGMIAAVGFNGAMTTQQLYRFRRLTIAGRTWHNPIIAVGGIHPGRLQDEIILGGNFLRAALRWRDRK